MNEYKKVAKLLCDTKLIRISRSDFDESVLEFCSSYSFKYNHK